MFKIKGKNIKFNFDEKMKKCMLCNQKAINRKKNIIINKYNFGKSFIIYRCLIIINLYIQIIPRNILNFIELKYSNISLTINGTGNKNIFCSTTNDFPRNNYPNKIYINEELQNSINYNYYFNESINYVKLIWENNTYNCANMFSGCSNILEIDLSNFDTSEVTFMNKMFSGCTKLIKLNLSKLNTSKVISMNSMFNNCERLTLLDLSSFDTSLVNNMNSMFYRCRALSTLDLSNFNTSKVTTMNVMFNGCISLRILNISNFNTSLVTNMFSMFNGCNSLISLDVSSFNTSSVTNMGGMFAGYKSSIPLNLSNFDTSKVKNMNDMFASCKSLTSLDLSNFDIRLVTKMDFMFSDCVNLEYINLRNFADNNREMPSNIFDKVPDNIIVCLNKKNGSIFNLLTQYKSCASIDCSDEWKLNQKKLVNKTGICINTLTQKEIIYKYEYQGIYYEDCINGNLINNIETKSCLCDEKCLFCPQEPLTKNLCINCSVGFYPIENNDNIYNGEYIDCFKEPKGYYLDINASLYKKCFYTCEACEIKGDNITHNCKKCNTEYTYGINKNNYLNCYRNCSYYHYFDDNNNYYCTNDSSCPSEYPYLQIDKLECMKDIENNAYESSVIIINDEIISSSEFYNEEEYSQNNIYNETISNIIYKSNDIDTNNELSSSTEFDNMKENSQNVIYDDAKTIIISYNTYESKDEIVNESTYKVSDIIGKNEEISTENNIIISTDININKSNEKNNEINLSSISSELYFEENISDDINGKEININETHINNTNNVNIDLKNIIKNLLSNETNELDQKFYDKVLEIIETGFISKNYNISDLDNGKDDIIKTEKINITLTTIQNQKNNINNNNTSIIDLESCENLLKQIYEIPINEALYLKKLEIYQDGMKIPKIEFDLYSKLPDGGLQKLNLSICNNNKISILLPINISENIDILNISSKYYNDICCISLKDQRLDIPLKDRIKNFIENNKTICQDDCDFSEYDYIKNIVKCSCKIKESSSSFSDMNINKSKIFEEKTNKNNFANFNILECYRSLFNKKGILYNIGSWILSFIILFHIVTIFLFYLKDIKSIKNKIDDIISEINNFNIIKVEEKKDKEIKFKNIDINCQIKSKNKYENRIKNNKSIKNRSLNKKYKLPIMNDVIIHKNYKNSDIDIDKKKQVKKINSYEENSGRKMINSNYEIDRYNINETKNIMNYSDNELNILSYSLAKIHDKRTFCKYYTSLLKIKHILLVIFYNNDDYYSKIVKFDSLFFFFAIHYAINTSFYNEDIIHKVYENNGIYILKYNFPKIIFSSLISMFLNIFFKLLILSNDTILKFKINLSNNNICDNKKNLMQKLGIKFISYFIISSLLLLFFWYYISMFGAIYRNNQYHLLKNTGISFVLSMIYPFGIFLLCGILRISALSEHNKNRKCMFYCSKVMQMI